MNIDASRSIELLESCLAKSHTFAIVFGVDILDGSIAVRELQNRGVCDLVVPSSSYATL
jgi:hypothetical protein